MPLPELLPILPFTRPVHGAATMPGSKSLTNRALLLAALNAGPVTLTGALFSEDTEIMIAALRTLGFTVEENAVRQTLRIEGRGGKIPAASGELFVGLAGTAARFLTALCAAAPRGFYRLDGVPQMRKRPMRGLIEALRALGADIRCLGTEGHFPLEVHAHGLTGGPVEIDASESSQMLSALLMVAPLASADVTVSLIRPVREPFVQMTVELLRRFGIEVAMPRDSDGRFSVRRGRIRLGPPASGPASGAAFPIEPDATAASYFLALPLVVGGELILPGFRSNSLQGDMQFASVIARTGLALAEGSAGLVASFAGGPTAGVSQDFTGFSDTFLTLAAISPLLAGPTQIQGIAHTRQQESDRVGGMARELQRLGQEVAETNDTLTITPRPLRPGQIVETYGDHRFAMSFGILGCHNLTRDGRPWLTIRDPGCCAKTFPGFFDLLDSLRTTALAP